MAVRRGLRQSQKPRQRLAITPSLRQSMMVLAMRLGDLRKFARQLTEENPWLDVHLPEPQIGTLPSSSAGQSMEFDADRLDQERLHPMTLAEFVMRQIGQNFNHPDQRALAFAMVPYLSPVGWLDPDAFPDLMQKGFDEQALQHVLTRLQSLEPCGVFARNLAECLYVQLSDQDLLTPSVTAALQHLDALENGIEALAKEAKISIDETQAALGVIRRCDPKPGAAFLQDEGDIFHPDLIISETDDGYAVTVNKGLMPEIRINEDLMADDDASKILLKKAKDDLQILGRSMAHRQEMLLAAGGLLVQHQSGFLKSGEAAIAPLSMTALADEMGCHKGTVSRLVADKMVDTPRGMMMMVDFFSAAVPQPNGQAVASRKIMALMRERLSTEDLSHPLTDQQLADHFKKQGITVARRTIAKYRHEAGFLGQAERQQALKAATNNPMLKQQRSPL